MVSVLPADVGVTHSHWIWYLQYSIEEQPNTGITAKSEYDAADAE